MTPQDWKDLLMEALRQGPWFCVLVTVVVGLVIGTKTAWPFITGSVNQFLAAHREGMDKLEKAIQGGAAQTEAMKIAFDGVQATVSTEIKGVRSDVAAAHGDIKRLLNRRRADRPEGGQDERSAN